MKEVFAELFRRYGEEDGMIWFKCGEAYRDRRQYADALANFQQAGQLFTMKEWRDLAISEAKVAEKQIPQARSLSATIQNELEEIDHLARDADVKKLSSEAVRVAGGSPSASILLSFAAIERIEKRLDRFPPELRARIQRLREIRNGIAHGPLVGELRYVGSFKDVLFDTLRFANGQRSSR